VQRRQCQRKRGIILVHLQVPNRILKNIDSDVLNTNWNTLNIKYVKFNSGSSKFVNFANATVNNFYEYGKTAEHINYTWKTAGGDGQITKNQQLVIDKISDLEGIDKIYLIESKDEDVYMVISQKNQSIKTIELAKKYWEIYDLINQEEHIYSFHFENYDSDEIPPHVKRAKLIYRR